MNTIVARTARSPAPPRAAGRLDRSARAVVHRGLHALTEGRLVLHDFEGTATFGRGGGLSAAVTVGDPAFYRLVVTGGSLGAAEGFVRGMWQADDLTTALRLFVRNAAAGEGLESGAARLAAPLARAWHVLRRNTRRGSRRNIHAHYDLGNELFALFLDETMTYSSGLFERPDATLADAQRSKLDRLCRKLRLSPQDHLLEIGTGWGSLAMHAAGRYGCRVTTTTISRRQHEVARSRIREAGLADRIDVRLEDYRDLRGRYDKLVSIEMIEAVGHRFLDTYFRTCSRLLKPDGAMALQAITMPDQQYRRYLRSADFIQRYVFPGSCLPSMGSMTRSIGRVTDMRVVDVRDLTGDYARTLQLWRKAFNANLDSVRALGYPEPFVRLWNYYLCYCEAGFAERYTGDVQVILGKPRFDVDDGPCA